VELFPPARAVGMFRGFSGSGLEFHADLTLPYRSDMNRLPTHGQFVLVELSEPSEAVLGRITAISSEGPLASPAGDDYGLRVLAERRPLPDDMRRQYLRYRVDVRLLGVVRTDGGELVFSPSHRRLPHVGSRVAFAPDAVLREIAGGSRRGSELGFFALGEFVYCGDDGRVERPRWMVPLHPKVPVRFAVDQLVARRSFVFARAGFGKSNLIKLLFARLYRATPAVRLRMGRDVPVGTVIFDPDGEYFWPDASGRPGLCDVAGLDQRVVVFSDRRPPSDFYGSFVAGGVKLDLRELPAALVLSVAIAPERQEHQNVRKLKTLRRADWRAVIDEVHRNGNRADERLLRARLRLGQQQDAELLAARANLTQVVQTLHDPGSATLERLVEALAAGKLCVVDISQMRGSAGLALSAIVLRHLFERNQAEFTKADPRPVPTIAVIEEAQSVLGDGARDDAYETWVKEGRKYNLGAVLVTQQPGSIPAELLSQGDNWFVFHLLSSGDLTALKSANAHFSDDLLSSLLNEPLPGNGVFWSSVAGATDQAGNAYPIPLRVLSFEGAYSPRDLGGDAGAVETYASKLAGRPRTAAADRDDRERAAVATLRRHARAEGWFLRSRAAIPRTAVEAVLARSAPDGTDAAAWARELMPAALAAVLGERGWRTVRRDAAGRETTWVVATRRARPRPDR
jgi:uncharacterized protein